MKVLLSFLVTVLWVGVSDAASMSGAPETHCVSAASQRVLETYSRYADEVLNHRDLNHIDALVAPSFRWHGAPPGMPDGIAALRHLLTDLGASFPDQRVKTRFALCADDLVLVQQEVTGTSHGPLLGHRSTGKPHRALHTEIYRIVDGRITELWGEGLFPLLLLQAGWKLVPPDAPPQTEPNGVRRVQHALPLLPGIPVAPAEKGQFGNLGQPTEVHCTDSALLATYYGFFDEVWISRRVDQLDKWVDPEFMGPEEHAGSPKGAAMVRGFEAFVSGAFPRRILFNDLILCADGIVGAYQTVVAINDGPFLGIPPTGILTRVTWTDTYRFRGGKVYQTLASDGDTLNTQRQLGWRLLAPDASAPSDEPVPWVDYYPYAR